MRLKIISILILSIILYSCDKDSSSELQVYVMVGEPGDQINKSFPLKKVRVEGQGFKGLKQIILDNKINVSFNSAYISDNAFIFDVPYDDKIGSRFGVQPITFITQSGTITKDFEIVQPVPMINKVSKDNLSVKIEGAWFYSISSVTFNGNPVSYTIVDPEEIKVDIPLSNFTGGELIITSPGGTAKQFLDESLFFDVKLVSDFDGGGLRGNNWFFYGDLLSFSPSVTGGPKGNYAQLKWTGQNALGYNGSSAGGGSNFLATAFNMASEGYIDIDASGTSGGMFFIQLNTIDGKNYGYNVTLTSTSWKTYSLRLSDFKDNYGFGVVIPNNPNPALVSEIKVGVLQGSTPNPTTINFDNVKVKYRL
jgi:hypothetical protein